MFYYIEGVVTVIEQGLAVVDAGGVGYACYTTMNTLSRLETGKKARLYTYCNIKEDAFDIYGFYDVNEKRCFEMLLTVSGVGPKAALAMLSANSPEGIAMAVISEDEKALTAAQGVGKRLAQRVILELRDKISTEYSGIPSGKSGQTVSAAMPGAKVTEAAAGLAVLGYTQAEITAALRGLDAEAMTTEEIIRTVLKNSLK